MRRPALGPCTFHIQESHHLAVTVERGESRRALTLTIAARWGCAAFYKLLHSERVTSRTCEHERGLSAGVLVFEICVPVEEDVDGL